MRKFQKKLTKKFFKNSKRNYFGPFWAFCLYLGKNEFSWKKGLSDFKYSNYLPRCKKSRNSWPIPDKYVELTNGQTDRQTNRQTVRLWWFYKTLHRARVMSKLGTGKIWNFWRSLPYWRTKVLFAFTSTRQGSIRKMIPKLTKIYNKD